MLPMSIFFPYIEAILGSNILDIETYSSIQKYVYLYILLILINTEDVCPFIAYCVTEFELHVVFHRLIFWHFMFIPPITQNKTTCEI